MKKNISQTKRYRSLFLILLLLLSTFSFIPTTQAGSFSLKDTQDDGGYYTHILSEGGLANRFYAAQGSAGIGQYNLGSGGSITLQQGDNNAVGDVDVAMLSGMTTYFFVALGSNGLAVYDYDGFSLNYHLAQDDGYDINSVYCDGTYIYCSAEGDGVIAYSWDGGSWPGTLTLEGSIDDGGTYRCVRGFSPYSVIFTGGNDGMDSCIRAYSFDGDDFTLLDTETAGTYDCVHIVWNGYDNIIYTSNLDDGIYAYTYSMGTETFTYKGHVDDESSGVTYATVGDGTYIYAALDSIGIKAYTFDGSTFTAGAIQDDGGNYRGLCMGDYSGTTYILCGCGGDGMRTYTYTGGGIVAPTAHTYPADNIGQRTARLNGQMWDDGGETCTVRFIYGKTHSYGTNTSNQSKSIYEDFTASLTGLDPGTRYYYKAYGNNTAGSDLGDEEYFDTDPILAPTVTTNDETGSEETNTTLHGTLTADGGENCTVRFQYGLTTGYGTNTSNQTKATGNTFQIDVTGLAAGTVYHYRAVAINTAGKGVGVDKTFLTKPNAPTGLTIVCCPNGTQQNLSWNFGAGHYNATVVRGSLNGYPTSPQTGTAIYNGTANNCTHSGLNTRDTWYYRVWGYSAGGSHAFSDSYSGMAGYLSQLATVTTNATTSINRTGATLNGVLTFDGYDSCDVRFEYGLTTAYGNDTTNQTKETAQGTSTYVYAGGGEGQNYTPRLFQYYSSNMSKTNITGGKYLYPTAVTGQNIWSVLSDRYWVYAGGYTNQYTPWPNTHTTRTYKFSKTLLQYPSNWNFWAYTDLWGNNYQARISTIAQDDQHIYVSGMNWPADPTEGTRVNKYEKNDVGGTMTCVGYSLSRIWHASAWHAEGPNFIYALVVDDTYVYSAGDNTSWTLPGPWPTPWSGYVRQMWKSNMTEKARSSLIGETRAMVDDDTYIYTLSGPTTSTKYLKQIWKTNMTRKTGIPTISGNLLAIDDTYLYVGGNTVSKYWLSNLTKKSELTGGYVSLLPHSSINSMAVDATYIYVGGRQSGYANFSNASKVYQYWQSNMTFKTSSVFYGVSDPSWGPGISSIALFSDIYTHTPATYSQRISSLVPGATYHYRAVAENGAGIAYGADMTFTTEIVGNITSQVYNESNPSQALIGWNIEIKNPDGSEVYVRLNTTNAFYIDPLLLPHGEVIIKVSKAGYRERIIYTTIENTSYFTTIFYLPSLTNPAVNQNSTADCVLRPYINSITVTDPGVDAIINLDHAIADIAVTVEIYNISLYGTYGGWIMVPENKYTLGTIIVTIDDSILDENTSMARVTYYYMYCPGRYDEPQLYYAQVVERVYVGDTIVFQPIEDAYISFKRYINTTGAYEVLSTLKTDANGKVNLWLFPSVIHIVSITKAGFEDRIADYIPPPANQYGQTDLVLFRIIRIAGGGVPIYGSLFRNITYTLRPSNTQHTGAFTLWYNISSSDSMLEWYRLIVYYQPFNSTTWTLVHNTTGVNPAGGSLSYTTSGAKGRYSVECWFKKTGYDAYEIFNTGSMVYFCKLVKTTANLIPDEAYFIIMIVLMLVGMGLCMLYFSTGPVTGYVGLGIMAFMLYLHDISINVGIVIGGVNQPFSGWVIFGITFLIYTAALFLWTRL